MFAEISPLVSAGGTCRSSSAPPGGTCWSKTLCFKEDAAEMLPVQTVFRSFPVLITANGTSRLWEALMLSG